MLEVDPADQERAAVAQAIDAVARAVADLRPALAEIGAALVAETRSRFQTATGPDGAPWAPRSPRSQSRRPLLGGGSGVIAKTIFARIVDAADLEIGSGFPHAAIHQSGGVIQGHPWLTIEFPDGGFARVRQVALPARPLLGFTEADAARVIAILTRAITTAAGTAGAGGSNA